MNPQRAFSVMSWPLASGLLLGLVAVALIFAAPLARVGKGGYEGG